MKPPARGIVITILLTLLLAGVAQAQKGGERRAEARKDGTFFISLLWLGNYNVKLPRYDDPEMAKKLNAQIPERILDLDGQRVEVEGFAMPIEFGGAGAVTRMMLVADIAGCCFGGIMKFNEMIEVEIPAPGKKGVVNAKAYSVKGTLRVGASEDEEYVTSIYRLEAEEVKENRFFAEEHKSLMEHWLGGRSRSREPAPGNDGYGGYR